ncbi:peptidase S1 domain-containing protein [Chloropicon roscoffensis]|uniref:Peptidase S1 domain-containing protein n=1 Tax=Chloropicon roscoffensis TaxID=1461544 RepID=A0AAX4P5N1_9CHLO
MLAIFVIALLLGEGGIAVTPSDHRRRRLQVSCPNDACIIEDVRTNYPFITSLTFTTDEGSSICTGSYVADSGWVLTAAHCCVNEGTGEVDPTTEVEIVFAPETKEDPNAPRVTIGADSVFPNPNYSSWEVGSVHENDDDACLLSFDPNEVDLTGLDVIDLVVSCGGGTCANPSDWDDQQVQVMGYGTTGNADEDENYDIPFRTITLTTVPCSEEGKNQDDVICTEDLDVGDVCAGDSGGPLLWPTILDGKAKFLQIGLVSRGPECDDRINDPGASESPRGAGLEGTWTFIPYQGKFLCDTAELCDPVEEGELPGEGDAVEEVEGDATEEEGG